MHRNRISPFEESSRSLTLFLPSPTHCLRFESRLLYCLPSYLFPSLFVLCGNLLPHPMAAILCRNSSLLKGSANQFSFCCLDKNTHAHSTNAILVTKIAGGNLLMSLFGLVPPRSGSRIGTAFQQLPNHKEIQCFFFSALLPPSAQISDA